MKSVTTQLRVASERVGHALRRDFEPARDLDLSDILLRLGLLGTGAWLIHVLLQVVSSGLLIQYHGFVWLSIGIGLLALILVGSAGLTRPANAWRWLILLSMCGMLLAQAAMWVYNTNSPVVVKVDSALYIEFGGERLARGQNPYDWDYSAVFDIYRTDEGASTPLLDGSKAGLFPYPALSLWLVLPLQALGLPGVFVMLIAVQLAVMWLIFTTAPRALQPVSLFPLLLTDLYSYLTLGGNIDMLWALLITLMIVLWKRPTPRAILYGLAAAHKQNVWFLAPFLLIYLYQTETENGGDGWRAMRRFVLTSAVAFGVVNLPFFVWNPRAWWNGVMTPLQVDMVFLSQGGLSGLTQFGYLPLPKVYYTVLAFTMLGLLLFIYFRHFHQLRYAFLLAPAFVMWFSYRNLTAYWIYWAIPAAVMILRHMSEQAPARSRAAPDWSRTISVIVVTVTGLIALGGVLLATQPPEVQMRLIPPYYTVDGVVSRLSVEVKNDSSTPFAPRFAVHHPGTVNNPLPWLIESGPLSLAPGQTAVYQIASDGVSSIVAHDSGQLIMTDAGRDYGRQAVATIGPERTFLWPDAIPNPDFLYWDKYTSVPIFWALDVQPFGAGHINLVGQAGRSALQMQLTSRFGGPKRVMMYNISTFPRRPFGFWVYRPAGDDTTQCGMEIRDSLNRKITFVFGAEDQSTDADRTPDAMSIVIQRPGPVNQWTYEEFDLPALYAEAGWDLPPLRYTSHRNILAAFRLVRIGLFVTSTSPQAAATAFYFSAIDQPGYQLDPKTLMAETLDDPAAYYARLAAYYISTRNYDQARDAYNQALRYAPDDAAILDGIAALETEDR